MISTFLSSGISRLLRFRTGKTRNSCKTCGASGVIVRVNAQGGNRKAYRCPLCHTDKYMPKKNDPKRNPKKGV